MSDNLNNFGSHDDSNNASSRGATACLGVGKADEQAKVQHSSGLDTRTDEQWNTTTDAVNDKRHIDNRSHKLDDTVNTDRQQRRGASRYTNHCEDLGGEVVQRISASQLVEEEQENGEDEATSVRGVGRDGLEDSEVVVSGDLGLLVLSLGADFHILGTNVGVIGG